MNPLLAIVVTILPRRYWRSIGGVGILLSGFLQLGLGLAGLGTVYARYSNRVGEGVAEATLQAAAQDEGGEVRVRAGHVMAVGALTPLGFFATSRAGIFWAYIVFSALVRMVGYATDHPWGDPLLTLVDDYFHDFLDGLIRRVRTLYRMAHQWWFR